MLRKSGSIVEKAKSLRKRETEAEKILWEQLRNYKLQGYKIRRQHPIGHYIADFYCPKVKLVIEVDGGIHNNLNVKEYDLIRQKSLEDDGLTVIRFQNEEVFQDLDHVITEIQKALITLS